MKIRDYELGPSFKKTLVGLTALTVKTQSLRLTVMMCEKRNQQIHNSLKK